MKEYRIIYDDGMVGEPFSDPSTVWITPVLDRGDKIEYRVVSDWKTYLDLRCSNCKQYVCECK